MFYYKTNFSKKAIFLKKIAKNPVEDMTGLKGGARLSTKISITFFVGIEVLNIFHLTIFSTKTIFFSKLTAKIIFGGKNIFEGTGRRATRMNITCFFFFGKWGIKYSF